LKWGKCPLTDCYYEHCFEKEENTITKQRDSKIWGCKEAATLEYALGTGVYCGLGSMLAFILKRGRELCNRD
jgi:hypothetical protein